MYTKITFVLWIIALTMVLARTLQQRYLRAHMFKFVFFAFSFFLVSKHMPVVDVQASVTASQDPWRTIVDQEEQNTLSDDVQDEEMVGDSYTVKAGDNLWKIARDHYDGNTHQNWLNLIEENVQTLISKNPNLIYPGEIIRLTP